jgi:hypothetical protein
VKENMHCLFGFNIKICKLKGTHLQSSGICKFKYKINSAYFLSPEFAKFINKMKNNKFYTVRTDPTFNQIIVEKGKFNPTKAHIHDRSLDWFSTGT